MVKRMIVNNSSAGLGDHLQLVRIIGSERETRQAPGSCMSF
jgi:hypothetical protein